MTQKVLLAIGGFGAMAVFVAGIFGITVYAAATEWCDLECGSYQNCDSPFDGLEVCADIQKAAETQKADVPIVFVKFTDITGERQIQDAYGRNLTGVKRGARSVEVGYNERMNRPCKTALKHEVRHLLLPPPHDPKHEMMHWGLFDGCH